MPAVVAAIVISTATGVWAERRWADRAGAAARRALMLVLYVVLPPATFFNISQAELDLAVGGGLLLAWVALAVALLVTWLVARRLGLSRAAIGSVLACLLVANTGYMGYPVVAVLQGLDQLSVAAVYDVLVSSPALLLGAFSVGAAFGERAGEGARERTRAFFTRNPPLYGAVLGLLAPDVLTPDVLVDASRIAIVSVLPLGFFAVGAALAENAEEGTIGVPPRLDAPVILAIGARMALAPLVLLALSAPLVDIPTTYLLLAAMPVGINTMIVAHAYGLDLRVAAAAVAWSTTIAVIALMSLSLLA